MSPRRSDEPPGLPVRQQAEPIRAVKAAGIVVDLHTARALFRPLAQGNLAYPVDAHAICARNELEHLAPAPGCTCGFYAFGEDHPDRPEIDAQGPREWTLEVELFGRIIRHRLGYRAARQRVLVARAPRHCALCHAAGDLRWARHLGLFPDGTVTGLCPPDFRRLVRSGEAIPLALPELRNLLGCEVEAPWLATWAPDVEDLGAEPPAVSGTLSGVTIQTGQGGTPGGWWDELPPEMRDVLGNTGQQQWVLPSRNPAWPIYFTTQAMADRLDLMLRSADGTPIWRRTLFFGTPPSP